MAPYVTGASVLRVKVGSGASTVRVCEALCDMACKNEICHLLLVKFLYDVTHRFIVARRTLSHYRYTSLMSHALPHDFIHSCVDKREPP